MKKFLMEPIGIIRSEIKKREDAPLFYTEGAPNAFLDIFPGYADGLERMQAGDEIIVITWLHRADREVLKVHPRGDLSNPLTGVFLTRSPDRPNPLGLHRVKVLEIVTIQAFCHRVHRAHRDMEKFVEQTRFVEKNVPYTEIMVSNALHEVVVASVNFAW